MTMTMQLSAIHFYPECHVIDADGSGVQTAQEALTRAELPFATGRTWTTDAFCRETRRRVQPSGRGLPDRGDGGLGADRGRPS